MLKMDTEAKGYYKAFGILLLTLLPSAFFAGSPLNGVQNVFNMWLYRWLPFFVIPLLIHDKRIVIKMLTAYIATIGIDSFLASGQSLILDIYRPNGLGGHYMHLATILSYFIPILTVIALDKRFSGRLNSIATISLICCLGGLILGNSRGAWLTSMIVLPIIIWPYVKNNKKVACIIGIVCCLLVGVFAVDITYQNRLKSIVNTTTDRSNADRIIIWHSACNMIKDHPIVGVGPKNFTSVYTAKYTSPYITQKLKNAHNFYLQLTAEYGVIGLCGFLYFFIYVLRKNYYALKENDPYARMCIGCVLGLLLFSLIEHTLNVSVIIRSFSFLLACLIVLDGAFKREKKVI